jgi:DNA repair exonuclease SbcCD ATPase subunit
MPAFQHGLYIAACTAIGAGVGAAALLKAENYARDVSELRYQLSAHENENETVANLSQTVKAQTARVMHKIEDFNRRLQGSEADYGSLQELSELVGRQGHELLSYADTQRELKENIARFDNATTTVQSSTKDTMQYIQAELLKYMEQLGNQYDSLRLEIDEMKGHDDVGLAIAPSSDNGSGVGGAMARLEVLNANFKSMSKEFVELTGQVHARLASFEAQKEGGGQPVK